MAVLDDAAKQKAEFFKQKRAEQLGQVAAQGQEQQDVIQRKFASMGAQNSGAQFGIAQKAQEAQAAQARQIQNDIMGQEIAAAEPDLARRFQAEQTKLGQEYATSERLGQQAYGSDEAGKQRQFQAGQQVAQNIFASSEAALGRKYTSEEQAKQNQFLAGQSQASRDLQSRLAADDSALKKSLADVQNAQNQQQLDLAKKQYEVDLETTEFNKILSLVMAGIPIAEAKKTIGASASTTAPANPAQAPTSAQTAEQVLSKKDQTNADRLEWARLQEIYKSPYSSREQMNEALVQLRALEAKHKSGETNLLAG